MADETRTADVQLTADVSNYTAGVDQAYKQTNLLIASVNKLSTSLEGMTKKIGKKLMIFTAGDVAMLTAGVVLAGKYEKQLATLNAQTTLNGKSLETYKNGITNLSKELPKSRGELVQLVTQINQLGITSERETLKMAKVFTNLSAATGDSVEGLTSGMIELGRAMGTLAGGAGMVENFSDSLVTVSNSAGVAATSVLNFAQSISPFARAAGIGQAQLIGISAAFTKAGADGYAAANTFNSIVTDITRQVQNGSPEIAKYANVIGVTIDQFKKMDMTERITSIFEAVNRAGPGAVRILDRLGQDGIRAAKSIAAVSNEAGGLRKSVRESVEAFGNGNTQKGADAAFDTIDSQLSMLKNQMEIFGSAIGEAVLPPAKLLLDTLNKMATSVSGFVAPLLKAAGLLGAVLAPFTAAAGTLMTLMGPLSTLMLVFMAAKFSPVRALIEGVGAGTASMSGGIPKKPGPMFEKVAQWRAEEARRLYPGYVPDQSIQKPPAYQMRMYQWGESLGASKFGVGASRYVPGSLAAAGTGAMKVLGSVFSGSTQWYKDATNLYGRKAILGPPIEKFDTWASDKKPQLSNMGSAFSSAIKSPFSDGGFFKKFTVEMDKATAATTAATGATTGNTGAKNANTGATGGETAAKRTSLAQHIKAAASMEAFVKATWSATTAMLRVPFAAGAFGVRAGAQILGGVGNALTSLPKMAGNLIGGGGVAGTVLLAGAGVAYLAKKASDDSRKNLLTGESSINLGPINTSLGIATKSLGEIATAAKEATREFQSMADASRLTSAEQVAAAKDGPADKRVKALTGSVDAVAYMKSMGEMSREQLNAVVKDLTSRFGYSRAQTMANQYLAETGGGMDVYGKDFSETVNPLINSAAYSTEQGFVGNLRTGASELTSSNVGGSINTALFGIPSLISKIAIFNKDEDSQSKIDQIMAAAAERTTYATTKYGTVAGNLSSEDDQATILRGLLAQKPGVGKKETLERYIKTIEAQSGEFNLDIGDDGSVTGPNGENIYSPADWYASQFDEKNQSPGAISFRTSAAAQNLTMDDYVLNNGKGLNTRAQEASRGSESEFSKQVRGSSLGAYALGNQVIKYATEGEGAANPNAVRKAVDALIDGIDSNKTATESSTTALINFKNAIGDSSDYLFQVADLALNKIQSLESYKAQSGGWVKSYLTEVRRLDDTINNPTATNDTVSAAEEARRGKQTELRERLGSIVLALTEFQIAQRRSIEDFDLQKKRALQDASAGWQSAYSRSGNQQQITDSPGLMQFNLEEEQGVVEGQLGALKKLKGMGLSQEAINMLNLTDASMGNQAIRMGDSASEDQVKAFNELAKEREKAVAKLTEEFSTPFTRAEEDFTKATNRAVEDMKRMGTEAKGNIKSLYKQATALAEVTGVAGMVGLTTALDAWLGSEASKERAEREGAEGAAANERDADYTRATNRNEADALNLSTPTSSMAERVVATLVNFTKQSVIDAHDAQDARPDNKPDDGWRLAYQNSLGEWVAKTPHGKKFNLTMEYGEEWINWENSEKAKFWRTDVVEAGLARGGLATAPHRTWIGEAGPELVTPLNQLGAKSMGNFYQQVSMEVVKQAAISGFASSTSYRGMGSSQTYNNSTNFNINSLRVESQDPEEMGRLLEQRKARTNLRKGAGGTN